MEEEGREGVEKARTGPRPDRGKEIKTACMLEVEGNG